MLPSFPDRDVEEPATKELVLLTRAELRADIAELRVEIEKLRGATTGGTEKLRGDAMGIQSLRADWHRSLRRAEFTIIAAVIAMGGVQLSAMVLFQS